MTIKDFFSSQNSGLTSPIESGFAITPHDTNDLAFMTRQIFVGTGGNLVVMLKGGDTLTLKNLPNAFVLDARVRKVLSTGTTAADLVGLY